MCLKDCVNYKFSDVHMGETLCARRCVDRFLAVQKIVSQVFAEMEPEQQQTDSASLSPADKSKELLSSG
jgi:Tim10/DDP family zinc finger